LPFRTIAGAEVKRGLFSSPKLVVTTNDGERHEVRCPVPEHLRDIIVASSAAPRGLRADRASSVLTKAQARAQYKRILSDLGKPAADAAALGAELADLIDRPDLLSFGRKERESAMRALVHAIVADDMVTGEESAALDKLCEALEYDTASIWPAMPELQPAFLVGLLNAGRHPGFETDRILLRKDELCYLAVEAQLMKEVVDREWQGRSSGYSLRITRGLTYRFGSSRGKLVEKGRSLAVDDTGDLVVTTRRTVFTGARRTLEMPHAKLLSLTVYSDGVRFHLANRQAPPLFLLAAGWSDAVSAFVTHAVQPFLDTSTPATGAPRTRETVRAAPVAAPALGGTPAPTSPASASNPQDPIPVALVEFPRFQVPQVGDDGRELRDPNTGQVVLGPWTIRVRGLHQDELDDADRRSLVKRIDERTGKDQWVVDPVARESWLIYLATVPDDRQKPGGWDDRGTRDELGASNGIEVIDRKLRPGEKNGVLSGISQVSGVNVSQGR
jgi:hypothetical protein